MNARPHIPDKKQLSRAGDALAGLDVPGAGHLLWTMGPRHFVFSAWWAAWLLQDSCCGARFPLSLRRSLGTLGFLAGRLQPALFFYPGSPGGGKPDRTFTRPSADYGTRFVAAAGLDQPAELVDAYGIAVGQRHLYQS